MQFISCANTKIPVLGFGTWRLEKEKCVHMVAEAIELGYRHIDTAQIYGNEAEVGQGVVDSGIARDEVFLTTKVWMDSTRPGPLHRSVEESLQKLGTDYVDLLLIHWPTEDVPVEKTLNAMAGLQQAGKARLIGVSNFTVALMKQASAANVANIVTNQVEYHPYLSQKPLLDYMRAENMFLTAYSPLARGKVTKEKCINDIAVKYGKTPAQVALRWLVQQRGVVAIPKAGQEEHAKANIAIFDFELTESEMNDISALACGERLIDPGWSPQWD